MVDRTRSRTRLRTRFFGLACTAAAALATLLASTPAEAAPSSNVRFGLGGGLGDPLGPSMKLFLHPSHALQFDLGWAPLHHGDGITHVNYLYHIPPFVQNDVMDFGMYVGVGTGVAFWASPHRVCYRRHRDPDDCYYYGRRHGTYRADGGAAWMMRIPAGVYFHWQSVPLDTVAEGGWSPYLIHWDPYHGDFSIKVRYYF